MTLTSPSTIVISDATQLERLTEIREKLIASPATESTLSDCKDFLQALLAELENKADGDETQPISGSVVVSNFPATQPVSVASLPLPLGASNAANSLSVTLATDGTFAQSFGNKEDPAAASNTVNTGFISLFKRLLGLLPAALTTAGRFLVDASIANFQDAALQSETALTAVGSTPARSCAGYKYMTYQVDLTGVGTSATVRVEGNLIGTNYDNLNPSNVDTMLTQNKSYLFTFEGKINNIRFTLVSFSGGTPSLTCHLLKGN